MTGLECGDASAKKWAPCDREAGHNGPHTWPLIPPPVPWQPPPPRTELLWCAIDLDGTLAEGVWTPSSSGREIGAPIERNVRKLEALRSAGYKTVIHSSRGYEHHEAVEAWLDFHRIPYHHIVLGKLLAAIYVDDRAVESEMLSWLPAEQATRQETSRKVYGLQFWE